MLPMLLRLCFYCCRWYITCRLPECFLYFSGFSSSFAWSVAVTVSTMYIICNVHPLSQAMWQHLATLLFCGPKPPAPLVTQENFAILLGNNFPSANATSTATATTVARCFHSCVYLYLFVGLFIYYLQQMWKTIHVRFLNFIA